MKKIISAVLIAAMLFGFAACTKNYGENFQTGLYVSREDAVRFPRISFTQKNTFRFIADNTYEIIIEGTYTIEENTLTLKSEDGDTFCFDIKEDSIRYDEDASSVTKFADVSDFIQDKDELFVSRKSTTTSAPAQ